MCSCRNLLVLILCVASGWPAAGRPALAALPEETKEQIDSRMAWWRDAKFGMFIHWGLYSVPAGHWKGAKVAGFGEWIMDRAQISRDDYAPLQQQFNPLKFDAKRWVAAAKGAGMKYIVITTKHHDGFCLFPSQLTDYCIKNTPFHRDPLKELADECRRQGIQIGWYYSIMDWHHPDAHGAGFPHYAEYMRGQLHELLTGYGPISMLWFDGDWIKEWTEPQGVELEKYLRGLQPNLIVNNRVGKRRTAQDLKQRPPGDFGTPEQKIPDGGTPGIDWETCMTMNDTWGFKSDDTNWKSTDTLLHNLVDIASKGGNFLLNVGPTAEGEIPAASTERLAAMGRWLKVNGESIYGTAACPLPAPAWGRYTAKPGRLYLHVWHWPADGRLIVPGLKNKVGKAYLLSSPSAALEVGRSGEGVLVKAPVKASDPLDTVVALEIEGEIKS